MIELETNNKLLEACLKGDQKARKKLYDLYAPQMMSVCYRYLKNDEAAKEVFQQAFFNVFKNLKQLKDPKTLSGWIKQIFVNAALTNLNSKKRLYLIGELSDANNGFENQNQAIDNLEVEVIMNMIENLPAGCRTVFNMYAIDGYSHKEIAEHLGISVGTSKSQLHDARKMLQKWIRANENVQMKVKTQ
ncbi:MAG: sigma-70 family RNA polymerase sigma factor [Crocinitomix sp.]|nr:sigma-70 family RNA polymerase sigma factor [Crocinitomix sp.]